jgi:hypothetical protein
MEVRPGPCIEIESVEAEEFRVRWGTLKDLITYSVSIEPQLANFVNGNTTLPGIHVDNLAPETSYKVTLLTHLTGGRMFTTVETIETMSKIGAVMAGFTRSTSTKLKWAHNPQFAGYDIQIIPEISGFSNGVHLGKQTEYSIEGFAPGSRYMITVNGIGYAGFNYRSNKGKIFLQTAPDAQVFLRVNIISWNLYYKLK